MKREIQEKFDRYPEHITPLMLALRSLMFSVAENHNLGEVQETLKWGEPSYLVNKGSPVRIDWKPQSPNQYYIFFHCQTKLVDTFSELYLNAIEFQGNRAIVLNVDQRLPEAIVRHCVKLAFQYKAIKHLPLLGA